MSYDLLTANVLRTVGDPTGRRSLAVVHEAYARDEIDAIEMERRIALILRAAEQAPR